MTRRLFVAGVFFLSLAVYSYTMLPDVGFTDSGELAGACASLGVAHPTGYPLFVLLGHLWTLLPLPMTVIVKMNLFAAVCTAFSVTMMFLLLHLLLEWWDASAISILSKNKTPAQEKRKKRKTESGDASAVAASATTDTFSTPAVSNMVRLMVAACGALLYAFSRTTWDQAVGIEVYSLHLALVTSTLYLFCKGIIHSSGKYLRAAALMLGLSFTNHLTIILLIIPVVVLFFKRPNESVSITSGRLRQFALLLLIVISCAVVYVSLPVLSSAGPTFNWGSVHRGWEQFSYHVFGKQYSIWMFSDEPGAVKKQFELFTSLLPHNLAYIGIALALFGLQALLRSPARRAIGQFLLLLCVFGVGYSINYSIPDIDSYFLSTFIALVCCATVGVYALATKYPVTAYACAILPVISFADNVGACNQRSNTLVRDYVHCMIDPLPANAVLISQQWDFLCSAFWYMQQVEGYRKDVVLIEKELLRRTWYPDQLLRWYPDFISKAKEPMENYLKDLRGFESDSKEFMLDSRRTQSIQAKFITLLNSFVSNAIISKRAVFATPDVLQSESDFASAYTPVPYGLTLRLDQSTNSPILCQPRTLPIHSFVLAARSNQRSRLEKEIASLASRELMNNVNVALAVQNTSAAEWYCRRAVETDPRNKEAQLMLEKLITR